VSDSNSESDILLDSDYETDYEAGQDNVNPFGLEMHNPVFFISALLIIIFVVSTLVFPALSKEWFEATKSWTLQYFDWFFVIASNIVLFFCWAAMMRKPNLAQPLG